LLGKDAKVFWITKDWGNVLLWLPKKKIEGQKGKTIIARKRRGEAVGHHYWEECAWLKLVQCCCVAKGGKGRSV